MSNLRQITKSTCQEILIKYKSKKIFRVVIFVCLCLIFAVQQLNLSKTAYVYILVSLVMLSIAVICIIYASIKHRIKNGTAYFIEEDRFLGATRKTVLSRYRGRYNKYTVQFSQNGTFVINLYQRNENDKSSCDYITVNCSKPNDKVYLLMSNKKIVKCFNSNYFSVNSSEFTFVDGRYISK